MKRYFTLCLSVFIYTISISAQINYRSPLDIPLVLSANFGELRPNHFHSGIDLKTQGVINKPVYSIEDGYVSRISVSPSGYGLAIYVNHITGHTSVYGHIKSFAPAIAKYVKEKQYEQETYRVDLTLDQSVFPVKKGDLIAYSGNTGSSGGPHVHFEIRDTKTQNALDALEYYENRITDNVAPQVKGIALYPVVGKGTVNNMQIPFRKSTENSAPKKAKGKVNVSDTIFAWGKIGAGIYAIDRMTGTNNIYGVKQVRLYCDNKEIFSSDISFVDFAQTRMINSLTDFNYWYTKKVFYMKSFVEPGNKLPIYKNVVNNGYINIDKEKPYEFRYELIDLYDNKSTYQFTVYGRKCDIASPANYDQLMPWNEDNLYSRDLFSISIPKGNLYDNIYFSLKRTLSSTYLSSIYKVHGEYVPLDGYADMTIKLVKDTVDNKDQYGIVKLNNGKEYWVGGKYHNGAVSVRIRELGNTYTISTDTQAPVITPVMPAKWISQGEIKFRVIDNKSGVAFCKGIIDGNFVLFENDVKSPVYTYRIDTNRIKKGQNHKLIFVAKDACGNESRYEYEFKY